MSYNAVLTDRKDEQVLPITTAENVFYSGSKTVKGIIDDIIAGRISGGGGLNSTNTNYNSEQVSGLGLGTSTYPEQG